MYDYQFPDTAFALWALIRHTRDALYKVVERELAKVGLTPEKINALGACKQYHGPLTPAEISRFLFRESATVAGLLARMEKEGLVVRVPKRKGKPFTEVKITAKGEELHRAGVEVLAAFVPKIVSCLSPEEVDQLHKLLRTLRQRALDEAGIELKPLPSQFRPGVKEVTIDTQP